MDNMLVWIGLLVAGVLASYLSVPALVGGLRAQAPFDYQVLGSPEPSEIFARYPNGMQYRFAWFVLRGRAYAVTRGSTRVSALIAWLGYVLTLTAFFGFLFQGELHV